MEIRWINWNRYVEVYIDQNCKNQVELLNDYSTSPIIHSMYTDGVKIHYNKGMETHLLLLNLAKISPQRFLKITVLYELATIFLEFSYLDSAEYILEELKKEKNVVLKASDIVSVPIDLDFQFEFFVGHERAHNLYNINSIIKDEARNKLKEIIDLYSYPRNLMQLLFFPKIKKIFNSEIFIEEMCCDRNSIVYYLREIPKTKTIEAIKQLSQLLYMLQLHKDLEELIGFSISKGFTKHMARFYFDVIRGANIAQSILDRSSQIEVESLIDREVIKKLIIENSQFYNNINKALLSLWKSDNDIFISITGNCPDTKDHRRRDSLIEELEEVSGIINKMVSPYR